MKKHAARKGRDGTAPADEAGAAKALRGKHLRFAQEFVVDRNATQAYKRAGYKAQGHSAEVNAGRLLRNAAVQAEIDRLTVEQGKRTEITADLVIAELAGIARADANELSEHRRICCRYCWGKGNRYQRTRGEMERDREAHEERVRELEAKKKASKIKPFDEKGGIGYDRRRDPNPQCEECFGDGETFVVLKDTRKLSPAARALYAGVEITKEGIKLHTNSKDGALVNLGKHFKLFKEQVEHTGRLVVEDHTRYD